ncbi:ribokinase [Chloroflexota bacterium]|nr:ribokinase [Chloroflexota bacterium]
MNSIAVIGSLNIDLVVQTTRVPEAGETLSGDSFNVIPGGKGANQAVAASRAGGSVFMFGCVGQDTFGPKMISELQKAGVNTEFVETVADVSTGTATILVEQSGENRIVIVPGANAYVTPEWIDDRWDEISKSSLILLQHEVPLETVFHIIHRAAEDNIPVVLNPAPIYPIPENYLKQVSVLIVNEIECASLVGFPITDRLRAKEAAEILHYQGIDTVIVTLGSGGAFILNTDTNFHQPAFQVEVVDTTAAGDTFVGAFAASMLQKKSTQEAMRFSSAAAALAVTELGAQTSIPNAEEVYRYLLENQTD